MQSVTEAASHAPAEHVRSLRTLIDLLAVQVESEQWQSLVAAAYVGFAEASGNSVYEDLIYDLWQALTRIGGHWDIGAHLWQTRGRAEQTLQAVVSEIARAEPHQAKAAMEAHLRVALER